MMYIYIYITAAERYYFALLYNINVRLSICSKCILEKIFFPPFLTKILIECLVGFAVTVNVLVLEVTGSIHPVASVLYFPHINKYICLLNKTKSDSFTNENIVQNYF